MTHLRYESPSSENTVDLRALRRTLGSFATGVTVVTTIGADGTPVGMTANSFTSVSLDPPLILVCIGTSAAGYPAFRDVGAFAVNILSVDQQPVSDIFATRGADKFAAVTWTSKATGAPVIDGVVGWLDCEVHERVDAGDHAILIGKVRDFSASAGAPLCFWGGGYRALDLTPDSRVKGDDR